MPSISYGDVATTPGSATLVSRPFSDVRHNANCQCWSASQTAHHLHKSLEQWGRGFNAGVDFRKPRWTPPKLDWWDSDFKIHGLKDHGPKLRIDTPEHLEMDGAIPVKHTKESSQKQKQYKQRPKYAGIDSIPWGLLLPRGVEVDGNKDTVFCDSGSEGFATSFQDDLRRLAT